MKFFLIFYLTPAGAQFLLWKHRIYLHSCDFNEDVLLPSFWNLKHLCYSMYMSISRSLNLVSEKTFFQRNQCQKKLALPHVHKLTGTVYGGALFQQLPSHLSNLDLLILSWWKTQDVGEHFMHNAAIERKKNQEAREWLAPARTQKKPRWSFLIFLRLLADKHLCFCSSRTGLNIGNQTCLWRVSYWSCKKHRRPAHLLKRKSLGPFFESVQTTS